MRDSLIPLFLLAAGCISDGQYVVRGTVTTHGTAPVAGATVSIPHCVPREDPTEIATTNAKGEYQARCAFGGMCFLFICPGGGIPDPTVEIAAPGYQTESARLKGERGDARVSQGRCDSSEQRNCFRIDVTLEPEID